MSTRIEALNPPPFFPNPAKHKAERIAENEEGYVMMKPALTNPIRYLLETNNKAVNLSARIMEDNIDEIGAYRQDLETYQQERVEKLKQVLNKEQNTGFFGLLIKVGTFVLSAISIVFGAFLIGTGAGTVVGAVMIAAGIGQIAITALEETGGWDFIAEKIANENEELRVKLRILLPACATIVCGILSVGSGVFAWNAINTAGKLLMVLKLATNLTVAVTTGAKGVHLAEMAWAESDHLELKKAIFKKQEHLDELTNQTVGIERLMRRSLDSAVRIINTQS